MAGSLHTPEHERLVRLLRQLRHDAGLRQVDLADRLGKPQSYVAKYEAGQRRLDFVEVAHIARALRIGLPEVVRRYERRR